MAETITIAVDRLRLRACHGVSHQERNVGNDFEVSVSLDYPPALEAAATDDLTFTVNYADLVDIVKEQMATPSQLLENVAHRIRAALVARYPRCRSGRVVVTKLLPPIPSTSLAGATVTLSW